MQNMILFTLFHIHDNLQAATNISDEILESRMASRSTTILSAGGWKDRSELAKINGRHESRDTGRRALPPAYLDDQGSPAGVLPQHAYRKKSFMANSFD